MISSEPVLSVGDYLFWKGITSRGKLVCFHFRNVFKAYIQNISDDLQLFWHHYIKKKFFYPVMAVFLNSCLTKEQTEN